LNEPVKVKDEFIANAFVIVLAAVTSIVPPFIVKIPVPSAALSPIFKVPAFKLAPPVKVLTPDMVKIPVVLFLITLPVPEIIPLNVVVFAPSIVKL